MGFVRILTRSRHDGAWSLTEEEDDIQTNYTGSEYIEDYFEQNSIEPVGYLHKQHDGRHGS